jgi:hypothetical protein
MSLLSSSGSFPAITDKINAASYADLAIGPIYRQRSCQRIYRILIQAHWNNSSPRNKSDSRLNAIKRSSIRRTNNRPIRLCPQCDLKSTPIPILDTGAKPALTATALPELLPQGSPPASNLNQSSPLKGGHAHRRHTQIVFVLLLKTIHWRY